MGGVDPAHARNRQILLGTKGPFSKIRIDRLTDRIRLVCRGLLEQMKQTPTFDFIYDFAAKLPSLVILDLLGIYEKHSLELREWTSVAMSNVSLHDHDFSTNHWNALKPIIIHFVENNRQSPQPGLIDDIMNHEDFKDRFSHDEFISLVKILLVGGQETAPNLFGNILLELFKQPALKEKVIAQPSLILALIEESMRHASPTQMVHRQTTRNVFVAGQEIPSGVDGFGPLGCVTDGHARGLEPVRLLLEPAGVGDNCSCPPNKKQHLVVGDRVDEVEAVGNG